MLGELLWVFCRAYYFMCDVGRIIVGSVKGVLLLVLCSAYYCMCCVERIIEDDDVLGLLL